MRLEYFDSKSLKKIAVHLIKCQRLIKFIRDKFHTALMLKIKV